MKKRLKQGEPRFAMMFPTVKRNIFTKGLYCILVVLNLTIPNSFRIALADGVPEGSKHSPHGFHYFVHELIKIT